MESLNIHSKTKSPVPNHPDVLRARRRACPLTETSVCVSSSLSQRSDWISRKHLSASWLLGARGCVVQGLGHPAGSAFSLQLAWLPSVGPASAQWPRPSTYQAPDSGQTHPGVQTKKAQGHGHVFQSMVAWTVAPEESQEMIPNQIAVMGGYLKRRQGLAVTCRVPCEHVCRPCSLPVSIRVGGSQGTPRPPSSHRGPGTSYLSPASFIRVPTTSPYEVRLPPFCSWSASGPAPRSAFFSWCGSRIS